MMTQHFGMSCNPFEKGACAFSDAFASEDQTQMIQRLGYLVRTGGLGVFTAPPGMGKTYAVGAFLKGLNPNLYTSAYVNLTTVGLTEFYGVICDAVGLDSGGRRSALFARIRSHIGRLCDENRQPLILVVDEAQHLRREILDDLKLLMNYEYDSRSCFSLVLLGEPVLNHILSKPIHESLRQRITVHYNYKGLTGDETRQYVEFKLKMAGAPVSIVNPGLMETLQALSHGNPRQTDRIMTQALTIASQQNKTALDAQTLMAADSSISLF